MNDVDEASGFTATRGTTVAGVIALTVTLVYFLLFADFALLELVRPQVGDVYGLRQVMGLLVLGGVAGSFLGVRRFRLELYPRTLATAFRAAGAAGALMLFAGAVGGWWLRLGAALAGLALGWLTVTLTAGLRATMGARRLGWVCGLGTGLAYALCNLPWLFTATPRTQTIVASLLMGAGAVAAAWLRPEEPSVETTADYRPPGVTRWVVALFALVWLDSAAFHVMQHPPGLPEPARTGGGTPGLWVNAGVHLVAAVAAGLALDRGWRARLLMGAFLLLAGACWTVSAPATAGVPTQVLYATGVSLCTVVLVYYPALGGRAWFAGMVFVIAGWLGSALGAGVATNWRSVPPLFVVTAGAVVAGALFLRWRARETRATETLS